jgi:hypothetical protein
MELVEFIFSSFWIFTGFAFLLCIVFNGIAQIINAIKGNYSTNEDDI